MPRIHRKADEKKGQKEPQKRRSRPDHDDDSSVDSHGNLRDLIDYEESEPTDTSDSSWRSGSASSGDKKGKKGRKVAGRSKVTEEEARPPRRKAAVKAEKRIHREEAKRRSKRDEDEDEDEDEEDEKHRKPRRRSRKDEDEDETEEEEDLDDTEEADEEDLEDEDEDEIDEDEIDDDDDDDDDEDEEDDDFDGRRPGIELVISDLGEAFGNKPAKPKKYKLSKEPENVKRFVKLVQSDVEPDEGDIDRDIGYFKALSPHGQDRVLTKLQRKVEPVEPSVPLKFQILLKDVAPEVERVAMAKYQALQNIDPSSTEYYKASQWVHGYTQLPLGVFKDLPVKLEDGQETCQQFVGSVRKHMDTAIYGHEDAKLQILQFVSQWIANPTAAGNVLSIYGPPGVGKTTLIKDGVAKALNRPFHFITLGGATDASFLDGHSYTYEGSTWGRIVDVLIKSKCMNPVIYFDELDKVSETPKGEEINNLLIHLTDGSQNDRFQDKYFTGIDLNLSRCLFIFSHNHHEKINPILRDRMYNIQVDGFDLKAKLVIAEQYLVPQALREVNLYEKVGINRDIITYIIENFTGDEKGVRELKRCIQTVISKINLLRFYNDPAKVPFSIKDFNLPFTIKRDHVDLFLRRKANTGLDASIAHLYT
jgi:flagellar biosynthesis GTPase FlhF